MKTAHLIMLVLLPYMALCQEVQKDYFPSGSLMHEGQVQNKKPIGLHKYYHENGQLRNISRFNKNGLWLSYLEWDYFGNLIKMENFSETYKNYPIRDFSKVKWETVSKEVSIFKFNHVDTISLLFTDSSIFQANYICYLENGKILDNSYAKGCPLSARIDYMIEGFQVGLKTMRPGETALIKIPASMGFGNEPQGNVPANSTLIYQIELLSIE